MSAPPQPIGGPLGIVAEALYRTAIATRAALYAGGILKTHRLEATVISVGNITAGGTGKTPVVIELARRLTDAGRKVAILSRGYGREGEGILREVPVGESLPGDGARLFGDEPCLMRRRLPLIPIVLAADRVEGGKRAIRDHGADLLLLDDGMQHRRICRDREIVVLSGSAPFGNGHLLPRGILREPVRSITRGDLLFINETEGRTDHLDRLLRNALAPEKRISFRYRPGDLLDPGDSSIGLEALRGQKVIALSAIGNPSSFKTILESAGAVVAGSRPFRDHHPFTEHELRETGDLARRQNAMVVTTEKDGERLAPDRRHAHKIHILTISFQLTGGGEYLQEIVERPGGEGE